MEANAALARLAAIATGRRSRWLVVAVWVVLLAVFAPLSTRLADVTEEEWGRPDGSQSKAVGELRAEHLPGGDTTPALLVYRRRGGLEAADRRLIAEDAAEARGVPLVRAVSSPFFSGDGAVAFTVLAFDQGTVSETTASLGRLRENRRERAGLESHLTGTTPILTDMSNVIKEADVTLLLATGLLVLVLLLAIYRSPALALVPLAVVVFAYMIATGLLYLLVQVGLPVSSNATTLLLVLMFGVGTDYCLLLVSRYRAALRQDSSAALAASVPLAAPAIIASGLTVIAALLALLAASLELNRAFAPANAIGIVVVLLACLTLLPSLLAILGHRAFWPSRSRVAFAEAQGEGSSGVWGRIGTLVLRRPRPVLLIVTALLGASALGLFVYKTDADMLPQFRTETDSTRGADIVSSAFPPGALAPVTALVQRTDGPVSAADVRQVQDRIRSVLGVADVSGIQDRSRDGRIAALAITFTGEPYSNRTLDRVALVHERLGETGPGLRVLLGGGAADRLDFREAAERDFKVIAPIALGVIFLTLMLLLRAVIAPLYLLATVLLSFAATLGLALLFFRFGLGQASVDPELPLVAFIFLVALGSDYNIFLMSRVREETAGRSTREGVLRALAATGAVITSAGVVLAGTFAALTVIPFYFLLELGIIVALGILLDTFVVRTLLVPALVTLAGDRSWWPFGPPSLEEAR